MKGADKDVSWIITGTIFTLPGISSDTLSTTQRCVFLKNDPSIKYLPSIKYP